MPRKRKDPDKLASATRSKLSSLPVKTVAELKEHERQFNEKVFQEIGMAKQRKAMIESYAPEILQPLREGIDATFDGKNKGGLGKGYMTENNRVKIEVSEDLKTEDKPEIISGLVQSISQSLYTGFYTALGLVNSPEALATSKKPVKASKAK